VAAAAKPRPVSKTTSVPTGRQALQPAAQITNRPTAPLPRHAVRAQPVPVAGSTDDEVEHDREHEMSELMDVDGTANAQSKLSNGSGLTPSLSGMKTMEHAPEVEASSAVSEHDEEEEEEEEGEDEDDWLALSESQARHVEQTLRDVRENYEDDVDMFDTTMVAEYADDIFKYMEQLEVGCLIPV
jgi:hypothetical protein